MTEKAPHYLPKSATADEACAWLEEQTGESWPLARLLESWLTPSVWLEYSPEAPKELFGDRHEGFLAPLLFNGDTNRMAHTRSGLLTMTRLPNGLFCRFSPGIPFDLSELRYSAKDLAKLVQGHQTGQETPADDDGGLAALFDGVRIEQLEAMFPDGGKWAKYAARARSGLGEAARESRGFYNPYKAARWWLTTGPDGWDWDKCCRKLASNLPDRSRDSKFLLTGEYD